MRTRRSTQRLPRYMTEKLLSGAVGFYFTLPHWARGKNCPVGNEALGTDREDAKKRVEDVLLPALDAWRTGNASPQDKVDAAPKIGTLDWVFAEYQADRRFFKNQQTGKPISGAMRRIRKSGMRMVGNFILSNGRRLGDANVSAITTALVDSLYDKLLVIEEKDADGNTIQRERRTTVNHAMKTCRRAWKVTARRNPGKMPLVNPFEKMGLASSDRETPTATFAELQAFRTKAIKMGLPSLATAALIGWEWLQRVTDVFGTFDVTHYRPKHRPNAVRVVHEKTGEENWIPLFDDKGGALYPELMAELDAIKRDRIGGLMIRRDWGERTPWPTWPDPNDPDHIDLTHMTRKVKEVMKAAELRGELTFTSFRHGGFTEGADADLTDAELRAQGRQKSNVLPRYAKRTMKQVEIGAKKRRSARTDGAQMSE